MPGQIESAQRHALEQLPDHQLAARVAAGEHGLFELIMRRYNQRLYRIARGILGSDAEAEDAVQEGYIRAYRKLDQFRGPEGFGGWLCRIVSNEALMRLRRQVRLRLAPISELDMATNQEAAMADPRSPAVNPEAALHEEQLKRLLAAAVDALPDAYRATFVLREVEQMTVAETAACLGVEQTTVKTRVHRARQLLQKNLSAELCAALPGTFDFDGARCDRLVARVFQRLNAAG
ncbi:RNA polymerase sigma factor [Alkalilimnicola sp. S0819]|uniref:RNA polymerase sigma factor n=1 Tax=Alkalilimnicola sp. S0819 TaxID=2613922 RepID=UPI001261876F|nr:RNA polymerase sigma factor [Alkalilimnicola sp. S0819]KAB7624197.1 RNA polymerase sigma factor [Alkalilimnicola sp. S0819]MPQ16452.1 RNA polymerase sigma factor [Alkalilimnicola sp. S0819]